MTREEAERLSRSLIGAIDASKCEMTDRAYLVTNVFVALGMLKLDEPPTLDQRINVTINRSLMSGKEKCAGTVKDALDAAGLKIVEK